LLLRLLRLLLMLVVKLRRRLWLLRLLRLLLRLLLLLMMMMRWLLRLLRLLDQVAALEAVPVRGCENPRGGVRRLRRRHVEVYLGAGAGRGCPGPVEAKGWNDGRDGAPRSGIQVVGIPGGGAVQTAQRAVVGRQHAATAPAS
jgi:hypothetical protein